MGVPYPLYYRYPVPTYGGQEVNPPSAIQPIVSPGTECDRPRSRTVYVGNIPLGVSLSQVLDFITIGLVESVKMVESKRCAFISFLEEAPTRTFFEQSRKKASKFAGQCAKIGWGDPTPIQESITDAVNRGANRCIFVGGVENSQTIQGLRDEFVSLGRLSISICCWRSTSRSLTSPTSPAR